MFVGFGRGVEGVDSIRKSPQNKVSRKPIEWDLTSCMRADGQIENRETRGKEESLLAIVSRRGLKPNIHFS
jgi:hypothetical protein